MIDSEWCRPELRRPSSLDCWTRSGTRVPRRRRCRRRARAATSRTQATANTAQHRDGGHESATSDALVSMYATLPGSADARLMQPAPPPCRML
ncbi:hypothetical protein OH76DRAFT_1051646 [Lentinus brumalis]|uniref:Uncharacterized protein n=1 Tax=Lentinus brumalis TaxID=2498619 RepID=A0A371CWH8_9APHY|nr:hypothetical protein OH76DRAFT_1051646 [Polyporus brumalis]